MRKLIIYLLAACIIAFVFTACGSRGAVSQSKTEPTSSTDLVENEEAVESVEIYLAAALDYVVEREDIDVATKTSNAIINATSFEVLFADETKCEIAVKYPDVASKVRDVAAALGEDADEEDIMAALADVEAAIADGKVDMIEKTIVAELAKNEDGTLRLVWTDELYDAVTGGLYTIE